MSSEEQHTPGPWVAGKAGGSIVSVDAGAVAEQQDRLGKDHIEFYGGAVISESVQNRDMPVIIAAPAMLAALEEIRRIGATPNLIAVANEAIAQARAQEPAT